MFFPRNTNALQNFHKEKKNVHFARETFQIESRRKYETRRSLYPDARVLTNNVPLQSQRYVWRSKFQEYESNEWKIKRILVGEIDDGALLSTLINSHSSEPTEAFLFRQRSETRARGLRGHTATLDGWMDIAFPGRSGGDVLLNTTNTPNQLYFNICTHRSFRNLFTHQFDTFFPLFLSAVFSLSSK